MDVAEIVLFSRNKYFINYEMVCTTLIELSEFMLLIVFNYENDYIAAVYYFVIQSIT